MMDHGLVGAVYHAAATAVDWAGFLQLLRVQVRADSAVLTLGDDAGRGGGTDGGDQVWTTWGGVLSDGAPADAGRSVSAKAQASDGTAALFRGGGAVMADSLRAGRTYDLEEIASASGPGGEITRAALAAQGIRYLRVMRVAEGEAGGNSLWLCIGRGARDFEAVHGATLSALAPHLQNAAPMFRRAQTAQHRHAWRAQAFGALGLGWVAFGPRGQVSDMDEGAATALEGLRGVTLLRGARPICADAELTAAFARALDQARGGAGVPVWLSRDPPVQMLLEPATATHGASRAATVLGLLRGPARKVADPSGILCDMFGLTRSEARLTLALAQGASITQAAADLCLTVETARSYTKLIYAKLGVPGQGGLIRAVLNSVVGLRLTP